MIVGLRLRARAGGNIIAVGKGAAIELKGGDEMAMEHDLAEVDSFIKDGEVLAEKYGPSAAQDFAVPPSDTTLRVLFTSWRGRALRFVQLQTGAHSELAQAFSKKCGSGGSYEDLQSGIEVLRLVRQGILHGTFQRKSIELFL